jgi:uncharacterized protein YndB with AHSA1/START domain
MPSSTPVQTASASANIAPDQMFKVVIKAPPRAVWAEITRTDVPIACFFNNRMHLGPGGLAPGTKMAMRTPDGKHTGVVGEILEIVPLKRFVHTFRFTDKNDPPCVVAYDLVEVQGGTEFTLTISRCVAGSKTQKQMVGGAKIITGTLKAVLEAGKPSFLIRTLYAVMPMFPVPKACRSENWPVN